MRLFSISFLILLFVSISVKLKAQVNDSNISDKEINVHFNKNVELVGYIINLADPEQNDPNHPVSVILNNAMEDQNLPSLQNIFGIAADMHYSFIIDLMYRLPEFPLHQDDFPTNELFAQLGIDPQEAQTIHTLLGYINDFVKASQFEASWTAMAPYREEVLKHFQQNLPPASLLLALESFYDQRFPYYTIVPSLTIWTGPGWGLKVDNPDGEIPTFILGPLAKNYDFTNREQFLNLAIHEFGHAFVNHVVLQEILEEIRESEHLYTALQEAMAKQGYLDWTTCIIEHFVRAGEVIVPLNMGDNAISEGLLTNYIQEKQFTYLPFIIDRLTTYRNEQGLSYRASVRQTMIDLNDTYGK